MQCPTRHNNEKMLTLSSQPSTVSAPDQERLAALGAAVPQLLTAFIGPLDGMASSLALLERGVQKQTKTGEPSLLTTVQDLKREVHRLWSLLDSARAFAAPSPYTLQVVNIEPVVDAVLAAKPVSSCGKNGIRIERLLDSPLPLVHGDEDKLEQALRCVVQNALEAMPQGGVLTLQAFDTEGAISIAVSDSGVGLPLDIGMDIFSLLTTTKPGRLGLGLPVARQIAVDHGGTLNYTCRLDHGTTFTFTLPVASER